MRTTTLAGLVLVSGIGCAVAAGAAAPQKRQSDAPQRSQRWWVIRLAGQPTGWVREDVEPAADGGSVTKQETLFAVNRLGSRVEIKTSVRYDEDAAGMLRRVHSEISSSHQSTVADGTVTAAGVELHTATGGHDYVRLLPIPGPLRGPQGAAALCRERLHAAHDEVSYFEFAADSLAVRQVTRSATAAARVEGAPALAVEERNDLTPAVAKLWLDGRGTTVRTVATLPFGEMDVVPASAEAAQLAAGGSELPGESYDRTLARSNVRLPDPRAMTAITLRLTQRRPDLGWPAFDGPNEQVIDKTATTVLLRVSRPPAPGAPPGTPGSAAGFDAASYLRPNAILQSDDAEVIRLAHEVVGTETDPWRSVRKLQDWTATHLDLDLGVALAPASEVARDRKGTCIAFATLLAAMERAVGVPSRLALGFVYYEGIWGGHAWTEVWIDGRWVPLDAAAYSPGVADAARIQMVSSTGEDNLAALVRAGGQTYGNVDVQVLEYTVGGRSVKVPEGAAPFTIDGDLYRNPWLGVAISKPAGARFTHLDAVYPDGTITAVEAGDARLTVEIESPRRAIDAAVAASLAEIAAPSGRLPSSPAAPASPATPASLGGRVAAMVSSGDGRVRLVAADGGILWVLTATAPDDARARRLMADVVAGWQWVSSPQ